MTTNSSAPQPARKPSVPKKTQRGPCWITCCSGRDTSPDGSTERSSDMGGFSAAPQYALTTTPVPSCRASATSDQPGPVQHYFAGLAGAHGRESLFEISVAVTMRDHGRDVQTGMDQHRHLVPGLIHLAAVDALDGDHVEDHFGPVERYFFCRNAEHGNLAAVRHVVDHVAEGRAVPGHFQPHVEAFCHA